jgi:hypothetical protein
MRGSLCADKTERFMEKREHSSLLPVAFIADSIKKVAPTGKLCDNTP